ncbi:hypothetical protein E9229_000855 [Paeniglutamicibacter cryotolerans]|uniref:Uncharacterized protein n=2 Tax=Paeniglutamicibacter cryotolerans TaxID=670079 RepID=A0A839QIU3_9MICC|nr:hypothetical protein [Paeniglutamicibacter cryotolerans]
MTPKPPPIPARTQRTASIIILLFAAAFLLFGQNMFQAGSHDSKTAQALQASGMPGIVTDVRAHVGRGSNNNMPRVLRLELTFAGTGGEEHTIETNHFSQSSNVFDISKRGWVDDFPARDEIIGQPVAYLLGESPAVEMTSELPAMATRGWTFPNYLGIALMIMGSGAAIGGTVSLMRAKHQIKLEKH